MLNPGGYFQPGSSWLHERHPQTKLLALSWLILAAFVLPLPWQAVLVGLVWIAAASTGLLPQLLRASRVGLVLLGSVFVVNAFFYPGAQDILVGLGPIRLSREGLEAAFLFASRILVALESSILFLFATLADDLLEALVARGVNPRIAFVVLSAMQMVPRLQAHAQAIIEAQQARGLDVGRSLLRRLRGLVPLIGPLLLGTLVDVRERTFALEARGFGSGLPRTAYRVVPDPPGDRPARWLLALGLLGLLVYGLARGAGALG
jgi:energy-coupling factor transport system permease protein